LSGARLRHARLAVTPTARQPVVRVGPFFRHNQSASRPIIPEKTPLNSALTFSSVFCYNSDSVSFINENTRDL